MNWSLRASPRPTVVSIAGALALVPYFLLGGDTLAGGIYWQVGSGALLAVALVHVVRLERPAPWLLMLGGMACIFAGDAAWLILDHATGSTRSPNVSDACYLAAYPLIAAGAIALMRRDRAWANIGASVDGLIVAVAAGVVLWVFVIGPTAAISTATGTRLAATAYPTGDLLLIVVGAQAAMRVRWSAVPALLLAGFSALIAADTWFVHLQVEGRYTSGHALDALWWASYVLVAAALVHPRLGDTSMLRVTGERAVSPRRLVVLAATTTVAPITIAARAAAGVDLELGPLLGGTIVLFLLVVARLAIVARQLESSRSQLEHDATHDPLTGLGNRALYNERVRQAIDATAATPDRAAVLCIDIDDFKTVNDSLGHSAGDRMLQEIGTRLRSVVRRADSVARLGGDEFAVLVFDEPADAALEVADRLLAEVAKPIVIDDHTVTQTSASIGIAFGAPGESVDSMMRDADVAMYLAKSHGKGRWEVYRPGMRQQVVDRFELRTDLAHALERRQLFLHYQPIIEVETGTVSGIEALVRWQHPVKGRIDPNRFIGIAEETGLIVPIGRWILIEACVQAQQLDAAGTGPRVAVNVSAVQLRSADLTADVTEALAVSGLAPHRLLLELTESAMIDDYAVAAERLTAIRSKGVRIALDDFGAGYTSLRQLQSFPVDVVKLDQSFINTTMEHDVGVLNGLISMANSLGLETVGEGIEEIAQLRRLRAAQCGYAQGYLFSRPVPAEELKSALAQAGNAAGEH